MAERDETSPIPSRKPWVAPLDYVAEADVADTGNFSYPGTDGAGPNSAS